MQTMGIKNMMLWEEEVILISNSMINPVSLRLARTKKVYFIINNDILKNLEGIPNPSKGLNNTSNN